jgi:hypothetical protein
MAKDHLEPIQIPNVHRLDRMPSWPAWVASRVASMKDEWQTSIADGKYRTVPTLPANLTLSQGERAEIETHVAALDVLSAQTPDNGAEWEGATLIIITKMMLVLPAQQQNEAAAEATGEAFQSALDDVPHWAVAAAVRRWHRGDCGVHDRGHPYDYHWRPDSAALRRIALSDVWRVKQRAVTLRRLLASEPLIEFGAEHRQQMQERFGTLIKELISRRAQAA